MNSHAIKFVVKIAVVIALIAFGSMPTLEAQTAHEDKTKNNTIHVYLWGAGISGDLNFPTGGDSVGISLDQLLENLEMAAMVAYKRDIGDWSVLLDVIYLNVGGSKDNSVTLPGDHGGSIDGNAELDLKTWVSGLYGGYTFARTEASEHQFIAGVRYLSLSGDLSLSVTGPRGSPLADRSLSAASDIWDGVIGFQGLFDLGGRWRLPYHLDIGTGNSKITYQALAGAAFEFGWGDLSLTYRYLYYDEGNDGVVHELTVDGPMLAVGFRF